LLKQNQLHRAATHPLTVLSKKAFLIGIGYPPETDGDDGEDITLRGPWGGVDRLKTLLIGEVFHVLLNRLLIHSKEKYGYHEDNITVLIDRPGVAEELRPTFDNIVSDTEW
jgi:hypothetical protein